MQYAQRLRAALPATRVGLRAILAVLTAFGIVLATAGVVAMPLLDEGKTAEDSENSSACHPAARMVYPDGQSAPEYVMPVYETGPGVGVESILSDWCSSAGEVLEDPTITLNVVEGKTVTPYLIPGIKAELERPAPANGEQDVFIPTDYLVKGVRQVTRDSGWEVGTRVFSLTYTSGTVSVTTGLFSFVKQDPNVINPPVPEPTSEPTAEPTSEPSAAPTAEPSAEPTPEPTPEPAPDPSVSPTPTPTPTSSAAPSSPAPPAPTPSAAPSASASPSMTASPSSSPSPTGAPLPEPTASAQPSASPSAVVETCQAKPAVQVLGSDGSDPQGDEPAYDPQNAVRIRGTGWCSQGTMLDGDKPVEIKVAAYGGYVVPRTLSVPVTFHHGTFDAQVNLSALYAAGNVDKGRYYLQLSPIDTGLTAGTNIFTLNKAVAPQPTPEPSPVPTPTPTAEPSATGAPTGEPAPEPTGSPAGPASTPSAEPSPESSASSAPSALPSETTSSVPAPHTTEPDQSARNRNPDDGGRPGTVNAPGSNPGGTGTGAGAGTDTGTGSQGDSSAPQAPDTGADSRSSTSQDGAAPQQAANAGAAPAPNVGGAGDVRGHAPEDSAASAQDSSEHEASSQRTVRPDRSPVPPVASAAHLSADNAGSLSGSRQGNIVNLILPKSKVKAGEWVSVFVFPGATTKGWVQVDDANSVSIDISTFESGSYELAVADRDNSLLGWAKLEIASASFDPRNPAQAQLLAFPDKETAPTTGLSTNDMLLGGAGGLLIVGAMSLLVAAFSGTPIRAPRSAERLRMLRRR